MAETIFSVSRERADIVIQEITAGSEPGGRFYVLVIVSTMIAGLGLINNSTAVIIGAMLVAPLMTPIFGISLALIRNDTRLFTRAVEAETAGVAAAICMGFFLGIITPTLEPTPEMLSRTQPQLFDLLVAIFSGFAGAYALVDEKISPALPGVAIATAIVPPLANTGLCISVGAYAGAFGSFLLFFSNFLAILVVGAVVFLLFRMNRRYEEPDRKVLAKRFLLPVLGIVVITVVFSHSLYKISHDRWMRKNIAEVLIDEMHDTPSLEYVDSIFQDGEDRIQVLASVFSVVTITPRHVARIQEALTKRLGKETELTIRATHSHSVSAPGSTSEVTERDLDGTFIAKEPHERVILTKTANSFVRDYLADYLGLIVERVLFFERGEKSYVLAVINGVFDPEQEILRDLETQLRQQLNRPDVTLLLRFQKSNTYSSEEQIRFELTGFVDLTRAQEDRVQKILPYLQKRFVEKPGISVSAITHSIINDTFQFYVDITSHSIFPKEAVADIENDIFTRLGEKIALYVISMPPQVTSSSGYERYEELSRRVNRKLHAKLKQNLEEILESSVN